MTRDEVLIELEKLGTEQNRKIYRRHGAKDPLYGVSFANLYALAKKIKRDHDLAVALWETGNCDAMTLATMIADPARLSAGTLDAWARRADNYGLADLVAKLAAQTPHARARAERWMASKQEWVGRAGWTVLSLLAASDRELPDAYFEERLGAIEGSIHTAKNYARAAMNNALIAIGVRNAALEKKAVAAARRIGRVEVDHGETGCKTPDAEAYIAKARARAAGKKKGTVARA
jgi:3-methyladenine DNA glycosylase AlkD